MINVKEWIHTAKKELSAVEAKEMCVCMGSFMTLGNQYLIYISFRL